MYRIFILISCLVLVFNCCFILSDANAQNIEWEQTYGDTNSNFLRAFTQTADDGFIMAGEFLPNNGDGNVWIVKTDADGNTEWEQYLDIYVGNIADIIQTGDGGYILGVTQSEYVEPIDDMVFAGDFNYMLIKIDANGNIEWQQPYVYDGEEQLRRVLQTTDGGYLLGGFSYYLDNFWIVKTDANGNVEWEQSYGGSVFDPFGDMVIATDGGYLLGGSVLSSDGDIGNNNGSYDFWVVKIDENGNIEWEQNYGGSDSDEMHSIIQTADGGYLLGGQSESTDGDLSGSVNNGSDDWWVVKIDVNGNLEWQQNYGGPIWDFLSDMIQTADGNYILIGRSGISNSSSGTYTWVVKIDENGMVIWEEEYYGSITQIPVGIIETGMNTYAIGNNKLVGEGDVYSFDYWLFSIVDFSNCEMGLPTLPLERKGALYGVTSFPTNGNETYTWYSLPDNKQVAQFVGHPYYSPASLGEYYLIVEDPDYPNCFQTIGPRIITELNGCCELETVED